MIENQYFQNKSTVTPPPGLERAPVSPSPSASSSSTALSSSTISSSSPTTSTTTVPANAWAVPLFRNMTANTSGGVSAGPHGSFSQQTHSSLHPPQQQYSQHFYESATSPSSTGVPSSMSAARHSPSTRYSTSLGAPGARDGTPPPIGSVGGMGGSGGGGGIGGVIPVAATTTTTASVAPGSQLPPGAGGGAFLDSVYSLWTPHDHRVESADEYNGDPAWQLAQQSALRRNSAPAVTHHAQQNDWAKWQNPSPVKQSFSFYDSPEESYSVGKSESSVGINTPSPVMPHTVVTPVHQQQDMMQHARLHPSDVLARKSMQPMPPASENYEVYQFETTPWDMSGHPPRKSPVGKLPDIGSMSIAGKPGHASPWDDTYSEQTPSPESAAGSPSFIQTQMDRRHSVATFHAREYSDEMEDYYHDFQEAKKAVPLKYSKPTGSIAQNRRHSLDPSLMGNQSKLPSQSPRQMYYHVEFKAGRTGVFFAEPEPTLRVGDFVLVEADRGKDLGKIIAMGREYHDLDAKVLYRLAQPSEISQLALKAVDEQKALTLCQQKIRQRKLMMEVVEAEYQWDRRKLTYFFSADKRVDFRELVRELFKIYKTRIWMCDIRNKK